MEDIIKEAPQLPRCFFCKHYEGVTKCKAFDVIPNEILSGENEHSKPLKDQKNNIVFESIE